MHCLWDTEKGWRISSYTVSPLPCHHLSVLLLGEADELMRLPWSTYAGGGGETKRREVGFHYEATSTSQSLFPSLPILKCPNLSSNPNTLPQWLPLPKDTHDLHITESHRYLQPYPGITLMSTSLIQHCPRVPQLCSLSAFPHLPTNTLQ